MARYTPLSFLRDVQLPTLRRLGPAYASAEAAVLQLAAFYQESQLKHREQIGGPALGLAQFDPGKGAMVGLVLTGPNKVTWARDAVDERGVDPDDFEAARQLAKEDDELAVILSRAGMWCDAKRLPRLGQEKEAWAAYRRIWNPGKPRPEKWADSYKRALDAWRELAGQTKPLTKDPTSRAAAAGGGAVALGSLASATSALRDWSDAHWLIPVMLGALALATAGTVVYLQARSR